MQPGSLSMINTLITLVLNFLGQFFVQNLSNLGVYLSLNVSLHGSGIVQCILRLFHCPHIRNTIEDSAHHQSTYLPNAIAGAEIVSFAGEAVFCHISISFRMGLPQLCFMAAFCHANERHFFFQTEHLIAMHDQWPHFALQRMTLGQVVTASLGTHFSSK